MTMKKIAITIPADVFEELEEVRAREDLSRSAFIRRALAAELAGSRRRDRVAEYVAGYRRCPEGPDEIRAAEAAATDLLAGEPWE